MSDKTCVDCGEKVPTICGHVAHRLLAPILSYHDGEIETQTHRAEAAEARAERAEQEADGGAETENLLNALESALEAISKRLSQHRIGERMLGRLEGTDTHIPLSTIYGDALRMIREYKAMRPLAAAPSAGAAQDGEQGRFNPFVHPSCVCGHSPYIHESAGEGRCGGVIKSGLEHCPCLLFEPSTRPDAAREEGKS